MASQTDDVGALFKSIGGDRNSYRELTRSAEAADSEERWPLLKSIPPERREPPPALSDLHKHQIWNSQENPAPRHREAPRHHSGLGEKLARSLLKITEGNLPFATSGDSASVAPAMRASAGYRHEPVSQYQPEPRERRRNSHQFGVPAAAAQNLAPARHTDPQRSGMFQSPRLQRTPAPTHAPLFQSRIESRGPAYTPTQGRAGGNEGLMFPDHPSVPSRAAESGRSIFSGYVAPQPAPGQSARGLFAREAPARQEQSTSRAGDSLKNIFKSLEGESDPSPAASGSRTAILGRLNRR